VHKCSELISVNAFDSIRANSENALDKIDTSGPQPEENDKTKLEQDEEL
jgi:hypothetical protein